MKPELLFRGVNKIEDDKNRGMLLPKGSSSQVALKLDGTWKLDGTYLCGLSIHNTARAHQIETGRYGGSGVSTTRSEKQAIKFATSGNIEEGFVYIIDERKLDAANVTAVEFLASLHPHEEEVTLIERTGGAIPPSVIVEKYAVDAQGNRRSK